MTQLKIDSKVAAGTEDAIVPHIAGLYANLTKRIIVIAELAPSERNEVAPDSDKKPWVKVQIEAIEVANPKQEEALRAALKALHTQRTAFGTLTEDLEAELTEAAIEDCAGELSLIEAARMHVLVDRLADYAMAKSRDQKLNQTDLRGELARLSRALRTSLDKDELPIGA